MQAGGDGRSQRMAGSHLQPAKRQKLSVAQQHDRKPWQASTVGSQSNKGREPISALDNVQ
jgi:hypothetical protein